MNKEILLIAEAVSNERGVEKELIFDALETALVYAVRKRHGSDINVRVTIDRHSGDYEAFRCWEVVEDPKYNGIEYPKRQISLSAALFFKEGIKIGDYIEEPIESAVFDRIAAQTAKQIIVQRIKDAERIKLLNSYKNRKGEIITGIIKRVERGNVILDLGNNIEAIIFKENVIVFESMKDPVPTRELILVGERIRGYLYDIKTDVKGPQLFVTRTAPEFLIELLKMEVPEIGRGQIQIVKTARIPGIRAKVAVKVADAGMNDPLGACIGMRGSRVQAVSKELNEEHIDVILWDENPAQFVINAMAPAEVLSIVIHTEDSSMDVIVKSDQVSQAIGYKGQNVRLASQLTGWTLNVMNEVEAVEKKETELRSLINLFCNQLHVEQDVAKILIEEGFTSIDEVAYLPVSKLSEIKKFDTDLVEKLRQNAKEAILIKAIAQEEFAEISPKLLKLNDMDNALAISLAAKGLITLDDLAEQSVDDLMLLKIDGLNEQRAANLIMQARAPLFSYARK